MIRRLSIAVLFAVGVTFAPLCQALAADFNGTWKGEVEFPDGQTRELIYTLKVDGEKLSGTIETSRGKLEINDGKVSGDSFKFSTMRGGTAVEHDGQWVDGKIKITAHTPNGDRDYMLSPAPATKPSGEGASAAPASKSSDGAAAAKINGKWEGKIKDENMGEIDLVYDIKADGGKLTGTVEGPAGKLDLENGTIDGNHMKFQVSFGDFHIQHDAELAGDKIKVTSHMNDHDRDYTLSRPVSVAGAWETTIKTPDGNEFHLSYDLKVDGNKLTGSVEGPAGSIDLKDGKVDGDSISYKATIGDNDVSYQGKVADGKIHVKSHGGPFGDREYDLTRPASDISGAWEATFKDDAGNDMPLKFDLKTDSEKLTGTVKSPQGDGELSNGKVSGDQVSFDVEFGGATIKHKGTVSGKEIKLHVAGFGSEWDLTLKRPAK